MVVVVIYKLNSNKIPQNMNRKGDPQCSCTKSHIVALGSIVQFVNRFMEDPVGFSESWGPRCFRSKLSAAWRLKMIIYLEDLLEIEMLIQEEKTHENGALYSLPTNNS